MHNDSASIGAVVTCAGLSSRMGAFKPLLPLDHKTVIEHTVDGLLDSGVDKVILVVGYRGNEIEHLFEKRRDRRIQITYNHEYRNTDMMASIKIGLNECQINNIDGIFILPGDIPKINDITFKSLVDCFREEKGRVILPLVNGRKIHPPLLSKLCIPYLLDFRGEGGLKKALEYFLGETYFCTIDDPGCTLDIDTSEDYQNLLNYMSTLND